MDGPLRGGQTLIRSRPAGGVLLGDGRRIDRRSAIGDSRFMSQTVPEKGALVGGADEVVVDLAGDITLQAANDEPNAKLAFRTTLRLDAEGSGLYLLAAHSRRPRREPVPDAPSVHP